MNAESPGSEFTFDNALVSLQGYSHIDVIPGKFFRRILEIIRANHVSREAACEKMSELLGPDCDVDAVRRKLDAYDQPEPIPRILSTRRSLARISRP